MEIQGSQNVICTNQILVVAWKCCPNCPKGNLFRVTYITCTVDMITLYRNYTDSPLNSSHVSVIRCVFELCTCCTWIQSTCLCYLGSCVSVSSWMLPVVNLDVLDRRLTLYLYNFPHVVQCLHWPFRNYQCNQSGKCVSGIVRDTVLIAQAH